MNVNKIIKRKVYCFWFGPKMSPDRQSCLKSIVKNSGVDVVLVMEKNIKDYIVESDPLFKGFDLLSSTHKSAYLRPYFMKHHGGCYMDIKYLDYDLNHYFDVLENSDKDFIGYREGLDSHGSWAKDWTEEEKSKIAGVCRYIFKPNTQFADLWYSKVLEYLNSIYNNLLINPGTYHHRAIPGGIFQYYEDKKNLIDHKKYGNYPIPWGRVFGKFLQETMYENMDVYMLGLPYTFRSSNDFINYR